MAAGVRAQFVNGIAGGWQQMRGGGENLFEETDYYRAFPSPSEVFANRVEEHSQFLLPVGTLSLRHLSEEWDGVIHFIMPIEPARGYELGEETKEYHNYLCRENWIGYRMLGDKCELACDFRFFHKAYFAEKPPTCDTARKEALVLAKYYPQTQQEFALHARFFREHGWLCQRPREWTVADEGKSWMRKPLVEDLGGISFAGNWSANMWGDFPLSRYPDRYEDGGKVYECDRALPRTEDGRDFSYIGDVAVWNYVDGNGEWRIFYDPRERIVLTTIEWS
jgi:hypothetical protein